MTAHTSLPLASVPALELRQITAGSLLANLGPDGVKVERPVGGDVVRDRPPLSSSEDGQVFSENAAFKTRRISLWFGAGTDDVFADWLVVGGAGGAQ